MLTADELERSKSRMIADYVYAQDNQATLARMYGAALTTGSTVEDVLASRIVAYPFHLLECCLVTDGGGALVVTSAERAGSFPKPAVHVLGTGESSETPMISQMVDFTESQAFRLAGRAASAFTSCGHASGLALGRDGQARDIRAIAMPAKPRFLSLPLRRRG